MNSEEFRAQLELEREWRENEIRFFHNLQEKLENDNDRKRLRRSIVGMLYAHIEGFVSSSFSLYVEAINDLELKCREVKPAIAAATLYREFAGLKNPAKKTSCSSERSLMTLNSIVYVVKLIFSKIFLPFREKR